MPPALGFAVPAPTGRVGGHRAGSSGWPSLPLRSFVKFGRISGSGTVSSMSISPAFRCRRGARDGISALLGHRYPTSWTKHERAKLAGSSVLLMLPFKAAV